MALIREKFTACARNSAITDSHLNGGYAARYTTGGEPENGKPGATLVGSAADALEVAGEIKGAINSDTCTVQTCGIMEFRTSATTSQINSRIGQGVQALDSSSSGLVENSGTVGVGFGRIIGSRIRGTQNYYVVDADANG